MAEMIFSSGGGFYEHNLRVVPGFIDYLYSYNSGYGDISYHQKYIDDFFT
jgi:hypothetical protein